MNAKKFTEKLRYREEVRQTQSGFWIHENKLPEILEEYQKIKAENLSISDVRISIPSDSEIHAMADEESLRQDTRDRMIHAMGLEQGATWIRNNIRAQLGSES